MLTNVTTRETNPFGDNPNTDPAAAPRSSVDKSAAAMTRLRTPFDTETDGERPAGHPEPGE